MKKIIFAGSTAIFGWDEISSVMKKNGMECSFVDADFMKPFYDKSEGPCTFVTAKEITEKFIDMETILIPLTEFWISQCVKFPLFCKISDIALKSSRSKSFFYRIMKENGFYVPHSYKTEEEAKKAVFSGKTIILKPDSLNSGYGVEEIDSSNIEKFEKFVFQTKNLKNHALKIFQIENTGIMFSEKIQGEEFSSDCFIYNGKIEIVRICRKKIIVLHDKPCCVGIQVLEKNDVLYKKASLELEKWCKILFDCKKNGDISFAQFDFIKNNENFIPIDFACRIGGGMKELFSEYKNFRGKNVYLEAIEKAFSDSSLLADEDTAENSKNSPLKRVTQLNYLPGFSDYITDDSYTKKIHPGKQMIFKRKGDYVTSNPTSVSSRIAISIFESDRNIEDFETKNQIIVNSQ